MSQVERESKEKRLEDTLRVEAAERKADELREKVEAAVVVDRRNTKLDADLTREMGRSRKLHNKIEDMKGKIRVYVRVRPMSGGEVERGCKVACLRDGNSSVTVLQPDKPSPKDKENFSFG